MKSKIDIYILIPVSGKYNGKQQKSNLLIQSYLDKLNETTKYECNERISKSINRYYLCNIDMAYYVDDDYDELKAIKFSAELVLTYQKDTKLGILQLLIPSCSLDASQVGDMVSKGYIKIYENNALISIKKYIQENFNLRFSGKCRTVYSMSLDNKIKENLEYLLVGEVEDSIHNGLKLKNSEINERARNDISVYDFYELYVSKSSFVYYTKKFSDVFEDNITEIVLLIFICEIAMLQNAAIIRINNQIMDELVENSNIKAKQTLNLQVEFGKTIILWENNIYNYENVQILSNRIVEAIGTKELFEEYKRNKEHIEQIASLKSGIASEIEGKVLNVLAFILSVADLVQIWNVIKGNINGEIVQYTVIAGTSFTVIFILLLIYRNRKKRTIV